MDVINNMSLAKVPPLSFLFHSSSHDRGTHRFLFVILLNPTNCKQLLVILFKIQSLHLFAPFRNLIKMIIYSEITDSKMLKLCICALNR